MVQIGMLVGTKVRFWANPQEYQTLVPAKNSHLKVFSGRINDFQHPTNLHGVFL